MKTILLGYIAAASALVAPAPLLAQTPVTDDVAIRSEIEELRQRLQALEAKLDMPKPATADTAANQPLTVPVQASSAALDASASRLTDMSVTADIAGGPINSPLQDPSIDAGFQLTAGTAGKRAELLLSRAISSTNFRGGSSGSGVFNTLSLSASAPLSDDGPTNIGTLDGFETGFSLKLRWTNYRVRLGRPTREDSDRVLKLAQEICLTRNASAGNLAKLCAGDDDVALFLQKYLPKSVFEASQAGYFPSSAAFAWGLEAELGYDEFKFLDPLTAGDLKEGRWPIGARLFGAVFPSDGRTSIIGSVAYQRTYKAARTRALCPVGAATLFQCAVGSVGVPARTNSYLASLGVRAAFETPAFIIPNIAIAPTVNYEAESDVFGIDVPIYLVPDTDGNLTGGLRFGYSTDGNDFSVGLFVGTTFSLFQ